MRIYLPLPRDVWDDLTAISMRELRNPRDQAVLLIIEGLRREKLRAQAPAAGRKRVESASRDASGRFVAKPDGMELGE